MNDILLDTDNDNDLQIAGGDFVVGFSDDRHKELLLICDKGDFKENCLVGVGLQNFVESEDSSGLLTEIRKQFMADGLTIEALNMNNGKFELQAHY